MWEDDEDEDDEEEEEEERLFDAFGEEDVASSSSKDVELCWTTAFAGIE